MLIRRPILNSKIHLMQKDSIKSYLHIYDGFDLFSDTRVTRRRTYLLSSSDSPSHFFTIGDENEWIKSSWYAPNEDEHLLEINEFMHWWRILFALYQARNVYFAIGDSNIRDWSKQYCSAYWENRRLVQVRIMCHVYLVFGGTVRDVFDNLPNTILITICWRAH